MTGGWGGRFQYNIWAECKAGQVIDFITWMGLGHYSQVLQVLYAPPVS